MSGSVGQSTPVLAVSNVVGAPAASMAGIAIAANQVADLVTSLHTPTNLAGWLQLVFGGLLLFAR